MKKSIIQTGDAPAAIGTYSQAVRVDHTVYMSGQIGLDPAWKSASKSAILASLK